MFYTFSTIAQTLAGAFGILGAFVLFRLQSLTNSIEGICDAIFDNARRLVPNMIRMPYVQQKWHEFYDAIKNGTLRDVFPDGHCSLSNEDFAILKGRLGEGLGHRDSVIKNLKSALWNTLITISLAIVLLPLVPLLSNFFWRALICVVVTVLMAIMCIFLYVSLVIKSLDLKSSHRKLTTEKEPEKSSD